MSKWMRMRFSLSGRLKKRSREPSRMTVPELMLCLFFELAFYLSTMMVFPVAA